MASWVNAQVSEPRQDMLDGVVSRLAEACSVGYLGSDRLGELLAERRLGAWVWWCYNADAPCGRGMASGRRACCRCHYRGQDLRGHGPGRCR